MSYDLDNPRDIPDGDSYTVAVGCSNCHHEGSASVPKGHRAERMECPICGCLTLRVRDRSRLRHAG
jgi:ribosomal protein S27E